MWEAARFAVCGGVFFTAPAKKRTISFLPFSKPKKFGSGEQVASHLEKPEALHICQGSDFLRHCQHVGPQQQEAQERRRGRRKAQEEGRRRCTTIESHRIIGAPTKVFAPGDW